MTSPCAAAVSSSACAAPDAAVSVSRSLSLDPRPMVEHRTFDETGVRRDPTQNGHVDEPKSRADLSVAKIREIGVSPAPATHHTRKATENQIGKKALRRCFRSTSGLTSCLMRRLRRWRRRFLQEQPLAKSAEKKRSRTSLSGGGPPANLNMLRRKARPTLRA